MFDILVLPPVEHTVTLFHLFRAVSSGGEREGREREGREEGQSNDAGATSGQRGTSVGEERHLSVSSSEGRPEVSVHLTTDPSHTQRWSV